MKKSSIALATVTLLLLASLVVNGLLQSKNNDLKKDVSDQQATIQSLEESLALDTDDNKFQGVFLTNGQVYFGKLSLEDHETYKLTDVYYLQDDGQLAKLGVDEPHKPEDTMYIERSQVSFWENLQNAKQFDGKLR